MRRFVAFLGRHCDAPPQTPAGWRIALDAPGALVFTPSSETPAAKAGEEVPFVLLLGDVRSGAAGIGAQKSAAAASAKLLAGVRGAYAAVLRDAETGRWSMLRDPSGRLPCFYAHHKGAFIAFAAIEDAIAFGWRAEGIDWPFMAALIQDGRIRDGRTALSGVREVLPGERVDETGARVQDWRPHFFVEDCGEDREEARTLLRDAVERSVAKAGARYRSILHLLSGGLDSSVVLACLSRAGLGKRVTCLTFTQGRGSELDEIRYARAAATAAGVRLIEAELHPERVRLERAEVFTMQPRPLGYAFSIENDDIERETAEALGAEAVFTGAGGDGLFFQLRARTYCADYLRRHGPTLEALRVAYDNARLSRISFWTALREGLRLADGKEPFDPAAGPRNPYLSRDLGDPAQGWLDAHPWFCNAPELSPGKRLHLWAVLDCLNLFYPYRRGELADTEFALITQPVIEAVLRIPSWVLTSGGRDRSLLREAFAGAVPDIVLRRGGKGAMDGYYAELAAANADHLRERLLDGALARQGLLDRESLERDLPLGGEPRDGREMLLLRLFAAEVWASAWSRAHAFA